MTKTILFISATLLLISAMYLYRKSVPIKKDIKKKESNDVITSDLFVSKLEELGYFKYTELRNI